MRKALIVAALLALALSVDAKRARREAENTPTGVMSLDGKVVPWGSGFAVLRQGLDGPEIAAFDAAGKNAKVLVAFKHKIHAWCPSPKETRIVWIEGQNLKSTDVASGKTTDLSPVSSAKIAISKDDTTVACLQEGKLVLLGEKRREIALEKNRVVRGFAFTGDGKWLMVTTAPWVTDGDAAPDRIERVDLAADEPKLEVAYAPKAAWIEFASANPADDRVAFVEEKQQVDPAAKRAQTLRVLSLASGKLADIAEEGNARDIAWSADGKDLLLVVIKGTRLAPSWVALQQLRRSGTAHVYWRDSISVDSEVDVWAPVAGPGGMWFLRGKAGEPKEVVRAELR